MNEPEWLTWHYKSCTCTTGIFFQLVSNSHIRLQCANVSLHWVSGT
uniref:Uncharacterized protein n=1 Tax=Anguilla anguilla TaxID=7936 RepID=A0A0E9XV50_ANGAN